MGKWRNEHNLSIARQALDEEEEIVRELVERGEQKEIAKKKALEIIKENYEKFDN